MNLTITRENLTKGVSAVSTVIPAKTSLPVLQNVLLEPRDGELWFTATDLDLTIRTKVPAETKEGGAITAPGKKLQELARELPEHPVALSATGDQLEVACGRSRFKLNGLPSEEFPGLPEVDFEEAWEVTTKELIELVQQTAFAVSTEESRPILNGILWELKGDRMVMVATNGHRLARMAVASASPTEANEALIVPPIALYQVEKLFGDSGELSVARSGNHLGFRAPEAELYTRLIEGKYPNYEQVIPKDNDKLATIDRQPLMEAVRRMAVVAAEPPHRTKLIFEPNQLRLGVTTSDLGEGTDEVGMEYEGDPQEIGFNAKYLQEVVGAMPRGEVRFSFKTSERAAVIQPADDSVDYLCLIMPLRIE